LETIPLSGPSRYPIPTNDHRIASIAIRNNFTLLTKDRHFNKIAGLTIADCNG